MNKIAEMSLESWDYLKRVKVLAAVKMNEKLDCVEERSATYDLNLLQNKKIRGNITWNQC